VRQNKNNILNLDHMETLQEDWWTFHTDTLHKFISLNCYNQICIFCLSQCDEENESESLFIGNEMKDERIKKFSQDYAEKPIVTTFCGHNFHTDCL